MDAETIIRTFVRIITNGSSGDNMICTAMLQTAGRPLFARWISLHQQDPFDLISIEMLKRSPNSNNDIGCGHRLNIADQDSAVSHLK